MPVDMKYVCCTFVGNDGFAWASRLIFILSSGGHRQLYPHLMESIAISINSSDKSVPLLRPSSKLAPAVEVGLSRVDGKFPLVEIFPEK